MNKGYHKYSTNLELKDLFQFIKDNHCSIYNLEIKNEITFYSKYKNHYLLISNEKIKYMYSIKYIGMIIRFFKIEKIISFICSILLLILLSHTIFDIQIIGDNQSINQYLNDLLNVKQLPYLIFDSKEIVERLKEANHKLNWVEVIQKGSVLKINYLPRLVIDENSYHSVDLIASKDCVIAGFDIIKGNKVVKINQNVKKGDLLVSHILLNSKLEEKTSDVIGQVYGYTFKKIEVIEKKNNLPISLQYYICLLKSRMQIELDESEMIIKEISLQFDDKSDTIRMLNFYVLYEMISIVGDSDE